MKIDKIIKLGAKYLIPKADKAVLNKALTVDGKLFIPKKEVDVLVKNCQHGFITDGKPIPNYLEKIEAVMRNPKEVENISCYWNSRTAGIWRAIQDPLDSTVKANPGLFFKA